MLLRGGRLRLTVEGEILTGRPGTLFVIPPGTRQYKKTTGQMRSTYLFFEAPPRRFEVATRAIDLSSESFVPRWMEDLCELYQTATRSPTGVLDGLLSVLLDRLMELEHRADRRRELHPALAAASAILENDPGAMLSVAQLAKQVNLSATRLTELFRAEYGRGPIRHQQWLRLRRAETLLRDPYLSVKEVAVACGYPDANYFVRLFKKRFNQTPGAWRRSDVR
jgi:AraC-like DNA-binding protein